MDMLVEKLSIDSGDIQVALVTLSDPPYIEFFLGDYTNKKDTLLAIRNAAFRRQLPDIPTALRQVREIIFDNRLGSRSDVPKTVVLVTDGFNAAASNIEQIKEQSKLNAVANIKTYVLGVGENLRDQRSLKLVASSPYLRHLFNIPKSPEALTDTPGEIISLFCEGWGYCTLCCMQCLHALLMYICVIYIFMLPNYLFFPNMFCQHFQHFMSLGFNMRIFFHRNI